ncbi:hypothetical protein ACFOY2_46560 [Nonomuraea purpurea]|uniref:Uncharacterized protein n=1 Tax=Nonomuraea purpurea TaxID=1849276 RepID=A0ABV8GLR2_9ACTN
MDEPIVDPTVSRLDRLRIVGASALLLGRSDPEPPRWVKHLFAVGAGVTGLGGTLFAAAALRTDYQSAGMAALMAFLVALLLIGVARPNAGRPLARRYTDRYVIPSELDSAGLTLVTRARQAIQEVTGSRVNGLGLLDGVANDIVLQARLWDVARLVRTQGALRAEQAEAVAAEMMTPELAAVLEPQKRALERSVAAVTELVWELEVYASRVRAADSALRAGELQRSDDKYRDLLAQTGDTEGVRALSEQADALTRSLREAIEAGQSLTY